MDNLYLNESIKEDLPEMDINIYIVQYNLHPLIH